MNTNTNANIVSNDDAIERFIATTLWRMIQDGSDLSSKNQEWINALSMDRAIMFVLALREDIDDFDVVDEKSFPDDGDDFGILEERMSNIKQDALDIQELALHVNSTASSEDRAALQSVVRAIHEAADQRIHGRVRAG